MIIDGKRIGKAPGYKRRYTTLPMYIVDYGEKKLIFRYLSNLQVEAQLSNNTMAKMRRALKRDKAWANEDIVVYKGEWLDFVK